jgi:Flp pilus assembly protein TadD
MTDGLRARRVSRHVVAVGIAAAVASAAILAGCSSLNSLEIADAGDIQSQDATDRPVQSSASELEKATEYWGKAYAKGDGAAALNYAKNLKAMGRKKEALAVLQQSHAQNPRNREHLSEYGRLALDLGQVSTAKTLLEQADDPAKPDWRVVSARGTVLAKEGHYTEAIATFERARVLAPGQASVLNNLAMAHAMNGEAAKAETLLRQAADAEGSDARVRQNLALVLGAQGKQGEAKAVAGTDLSDETAKANVEFLRKTAHADPKTGAIDTPAWPTTATVAPAKGRKSASPTPMATASIASNDPEEVIGAAMRAEATKSADPAGAR